MNRLVILLSLFLFVFVACQENEEILFQETGLVVDYAGAGDCGFVIELDNGKRIQPMYYPENYSFMHGQRVLVEYIELDNVINGCDRGIACDIKYVEELACAPYVDLYFENYDSLARDPVNVNAAYVDGDCLYFQVSYSGGCQKHTIDLARMHPWTAGSSKMPTFEIRHNANEDVCEGYFTKEFRFDIKQLKEEGVTEFVLTAKLMGGESYNKIFDLE